MEKFYQKLKRWSLYAMIFFIIVLFLWIIIYLIIETFDYTVFGGFTGNLFYAMIAGVIVILAALVILNVAVNLNIISDSLAKGGKSEDKRVSWKGVSIALGSVFFIIIFIGLALHFVNQENTRATTSGIQNELDQFKSAFTPQLGQIAEDVQGEKLPYRILSNLIIIEAHTAKMKDIEIIFPKMMNGSLVFLRLNRMSLPPKDKFISAISDSLFEIRDPEQLEYIKKVYETGTGGDQFFIKRPIITMYSPVFHDGKLAFFIYSAYNEIQGYYMKKGSDF
ncbi:MAG: hypothetical protein HPY53_02705 [Brevinematales bacterium]|nr:hypothetical protein [Brevinematales bacterium]